MIWYRMAAPRQITYAVLPPPRLPSSVFCPCVPLPNGCADGRGYGSGSGSGSGRVGLWLVLVLVLALALGSLPRLRPSLIIHSLPWPHLAAQPSLALSLSLTLF